jgi:hypothetical protein
VLDRKHGYGRRLGNHRFFWHLIPFDGPRISKGDRLNKSWHASSAAPELAKRISTRKRPRVRSYEIFFSLVLQDVAGGAAELHTDCELLAETSVQILSSILHERER